MRQRNDTGYPLLVAADPPFTVEPGEEIDHPERVTGLTDLDAPAEDDPADDKPAEGEPVKPQRRRRGQHDDPAEADAAGDDTPGGQQ